MGARRQSVAVRHAVESEERETYDKLAGNEDHDAAVGASGLGIKSRNLVHNAREGQ